MGSTVSSADELLVETARRFTEGRFTIEGVRMLRDGDRVEASARIREDWAELGSLGWAGLVVPEHLGGSSATWSTVGIVLEQLGRTLAVTPMVESGVVAASVLLGADGGPSDDLLAGVASGSVCVVLADDEGPLGGRVASGARAARRGGDHVLRGTKRHVVFGPVADAYLVTAGLDVHPEATSAAFLVPATAPGLSRHDGVLVDGRPVSVLELDDVVLPAEALVANEQCVEHAKALGGLALAASMSGGSSRALEVTVAYLKEREQFGVPIGAYQALQHRAAHLSCRAELATAIVRRALDAQDSDDPRAPRLAHASKAVLSDTYLEVAEEGVQMHGGIGMTDEAEIGFHLKAARVAGLTLGDAATHRRAYAAVGGY